MDEDPIRAKNQEWTAGSDARAARIKLFERVRDFPFEYPASRDPREILQRGRGSCSGKHYLLAEFFRQHGIPVRHMACTHQFNDSPLPFPDAMLELLAKNEIHDVHDYLQIQIDGNWVDVDATWELPLRDFGFPVTEDWDGESSMLLTVIPDEHHQLDIDPEKEKEEILSRLTPRQRKLRQQFLEALSKWVAEIEEETARDS